jgi:hypothetical protein
MNTPPPPPPPLDHTSVLSQLSNCLNSIKSLTETPVKPIPNPLDAQPEWKVLESVKRLIPWMQMGLRGFVGVFGHGHERFSSNITYQADV